MDWNQVSLEESPMDILLSWPQPHALWCRVNGFLLFIMLKFVTNFILLSSKVLNFFCRFLIMYSHTFGLMIKMYKMLFTSGRYTDCYHYSFQITKSKNEKITSYCYDDTQGTILNWVRCNKTLSYTYDVISTVEYHRNLTKRNYRSLIYRWQCLNSPSFFILLKF